MAAEDKVIRITCKGQKYVDLKSLKNFQGALKELTEEEFEKLKGSILEYGFSFPVFVWRSYILDGHQRLFVTEKLIREEGYQIGKIPVVEIEAKNKQEAAEKLLLLNSRYAEMTEEGLYQFAHNYTINIPQISGLISIPEINIDHFIAGYITDPAGGGGPGGDPGEDPDPDEERAQELQRKWKVKPGEVWEIPSNTLEGAIHRVMCADNRDPENIKRLFAGNKIRLLVTDPPYGIGAVRETKLGGGGPFRGVKRNLGRTGAGGVIPSNVYEPIEGDDGPFDPRPFLKLAKVTVLFGANCYSDKLPPSRGWIVWDKVHLLEGTSESYSDAELIWTNQDVPARLYRQTWHGMICEAEPGKRYTPTQKPVGLFRYIIERFTKEGDFLADLFAGFGPAVRAAEDTGRICFAMELKPQYVAVILEYLQQMGLEPRRSDNGTKSQQG